MPQYRSLKIIRYDAGIPTTIPAGAIAIFNTLTLPSNWTAYASQDGHFVMGNASVATGGSNTHTHPVNITTEETTSHIGWEYKSDGALAGTQTHTHTGSGTTAPSDHRPPYLEVIFAKADSDTTLPAGMIAMFNATPPSNWTVMSGPGQDFAGRFIVGNSTNYGNTGGNATHTHNNLVITTGKPSASSRGKSGSGDTAEAGSGIHTHNITVSFSSKSNLPPYINVTFAYYVAQPTPSATSWWNNKTNNDSLTLTINVSEEIEFGIVYDQTGNITWNATDYPDRSNLSVLSGNQTYNWSTSGTKYLNASMNNTNGTSSITEWCIVVQSISDAPSITSFAPTDTTPNDVEGETKTFNITVNQTVNVSWQINGTEVSTNTSVTDAKYTNTSAEVGYWNVSAIVTNANGSDIQTWWWTVSAPSEGDTTYDFSSGAGTDKWAYRWQASYPKPPTSNDVPSIQFTPAEYNKIKTNDGVFQSNQADRNYYAAHRFKFDIQESVGTITKIYVFWNGTGYHEWYTDGATLYIWNYNDDTYDQLDSTTSDSEVDLTGEITANFGNYIDTDGNLTVLIEQNYYTVRKSGALRDSHIETDYVKVDVTYTAANHPPTVETPETYNSSLIERYTFEIGENVTIRTNVTDPEGAGDIDAVLVKITHPNSTVMVNNETMTNVSGITNGYIYEYNYTVPEEPTSKGFWVVDVYANDTSDAKAAGSTFFKVISLNVTMNAGGPYNPGDTVYIDGWVLYANDTPVYEAAVELNSTDPDDNVVNCTTVYTNASGYYSTSYTLNDTAIIGMYTVETNVTKGDLQQTENATYSVSEVAQPSIIIIVTDKDVYLTTPQIWVDHGVAYYSPRVANITVLIMDEDGSCLHDKNLSVNVTYPNDSVQAVTMNEYDDGFWNGSFTVYHDDPTVTYTINATITNGASSSYNLTFDVDRFGCDSSNCHNYGWHKWGYSRGAHDASAHDAHYTHSPIPSRGGGRCRPCHTGQNLDCDECHTDIFRGTHADVSGSTLTDKCNHCHAGYNDSADTGIDKPVPKCSTSGCHGGEHKDKPAYLHNNTHADNKVDCGYCHNNMHSIFEPTCDLCHKSQNNHSSYNTTGVNCLQCHNDNLLNYSGSVLVNNTYWTNTSIHSQNEILPNCTICHTGYSNHSSYDTYGVYCTYCHNNATLNYSGSILPANTTYNTDTSIHTLNATEMKPGCTPCHYNKNNHTSYNTTGVICIQCHNNATLNYTGTKMYSAEYNTGTTVHTTNTTPASSSTLSPLCTTCHTKTGDEIETGYDNYAMNNDSNNLAPYGSNMTHKRDTITGTIWGTDPPDGNVRYARHANPDSSGGWSGATGAAREPNQICINCHSDRMRYWGILNENTWDDPENQHCTPCHDIWHDTPKPDAHNLSIPYCSDCHGQLNDPDSINHFAQIPVDINCTYCHFVVDVVDEEFDHINENFLNPPKDYTLTPSIGMMLNDSAHKRMILNTSTNHPTNYTGCMVCHTAVTFTANSTPDTLTINITDHSGAHTWNSKPTCTKCHSINDSVQRPGPYPYEHDILGMEWGNNTQCLECHNIYNQTAGRYHGHNATTESCTACHYNYTAMNDYGKPSVYVNETMYSESVHGTNPGANCSQCHTQHHPPPEYTWKWCECCHSHQSDPINETDRHNVTADPANYSVKGIDVLTITECTECHNATAYENAKANFNASAARDCRYCHSYPDDW